jgi:hypothetical protein
MWSHERHLQRHLRIERMRYTVLFVALLSCSSLGLSATDKTVSLASVASTLRVKVQIARTDITVTLEDKKGVGHCLKVDATARLAGLTMAVIDHGSSHTVTGNGPGSFETECHAPLFAIHDTATLFPKAGTVQLQITDSSTVFDLQIDGALADHAITLATPLDGKVHVGQPATLLLPVTTETIGSAKV